MRQHNAAFFALMEVDRLIIIHLVTLILYNTAVFSSFKSS